MSLAVATAVTVARLTLATGVSVEYVEHGPADGVPVIFLHGVTDSWRSFEHLLPHLPASIRAFAITQRGHGGSSKPDAGYAYGDFAADVAAFMDAKGLRSAVVVGHSMGGLVAQQFAHASPTRVRGLVLLGTFATIKGHAGVQGMWDGTLATLADPVDPAFAREFQESTLARPIPAGQLDTFVGESLKVPARVWRAAFRGFLDNDVARGAAPIAAPTLIVWADQDSFADRVERDRLAASIPGATVLEYTGHGHAMHWEDPARVAGDIARFVVGLPGRTSTDGSAVALTPQRAVLATGVTLEYVERGPADGVPVIFLHGVTDSWRSFEHLLPHLPASIRAFAITQRGHGGSSKPDAGYAYGDFAADVAAFLEAKGFPSTVIVGHSMGGQVAQRLAMDRPERVRGLVLVSTFHTLRGHELVQELWDTGIGTMQDPIDPAFVRAFQEGTVATPIAAAHMDTFVAESLKVPARVWRAAFREFLDADLGDQRRIAAPTLVLSGGKDPLSRSEERAALLGRIHGATAVDYADLGHAPHWERPAAIAGDIARFVAGLPAPRNERATVPQ